MFTKFGRTVGQPAPAFVALYGMGGSWRSSTRTHGSNDWRRGAGSGPRHLEASCRCARLKHLAIFGLHLKQLEVQMPFSRFAQSAAALLLSTVGLAAAAHAQHNKPIISGTWYEDRAATVNSSSVILLTFAQTPANQFLNITNVSCFASVLSGQVLTGAFLHAGNTSGSDDIGRVYPIMGNTTPVTVGDFTYFTFVTNQIYYKFGTSKFPTIEIDTLTTGSALQANAFCVIVGNLTNN
jgi:hypothetical protein